MEPRRFGSIVSECVPDIPQRVKDMLEPYSNVRSAMFQSFEHTRGGILITTRFAETAQVHHVSHPLAARRQLTFYEDAVMGVEKCPNPDCDVFLFQKDVGGGEFFQIFLHNMTSGKNTMITDGKSKNGNPIWSRAGDAIAYFSTRRNNKDWDIYIARVNLDGVVTHEEMVYSGSGSWLPVDWSPDGQSILLKKVVSALESYVYILHLATKTVTEISAGTGKIAYGSMRFTSDGQGVYLTCDYNHEFRTLRYYNRAVDQITDLTGSKINWDVDSIRVHTELGLVAFTTNEDGIGKLYTLKDGSELHHIPTPMGDISTIEFHPSGQKLAVVLSTAKVPGDVYLLDLKTEQFERWTESEVGGLNVELFIEPSLIHYPTFDKVIGSGGTEEPRQIPAFYYRPKLSGRLPVIIHIHGGPESQVTASFMPIYQYLMLEHSVAVIDPNVRGSSGYGKTYITLDDGKLREDSVKDIGSLIQWIKTQPDLDHDRIAVWGGSYGGYMVLASMIHFSDQLRAGVDVVGISNFVTFLESTQEYRRDLRRPEYGDERDPDMRAFLLAISPTNNAHKIQKPLMIVQGKNDPRVPISESEQMKEAIRGAGGQVWYVVAEDEGHGFRKKKNREYYYHAMDMFWSTFLLSSSEQSKL